MIYHNIWTDTTNIRQHHAGKVYTITYGTRPRIANSTDEYLTSNDDYGGESATWLLVNKQMLQEGLDQLSQEVTWHFGPSTQTDRKSRNSRLITPSKARGYQLRLGYAVLGLQVLFQNDECAKHFLQEWRPNDTNIPEIVNFTKRTTIVTVLHVDIQRIDVFGQPIQYTREDGHLDFHFWQMEQLGVCCKRLRKFSVTWQEEITSDEHWEEVRYDYEGDPEERYFEDLQEELSRIGRILIRNGRETVMSFDSYKAQFAKMKEDDRIARWEYMIEK